MTSHRIGVNLRVSGNCDQGARKYMEDNHIIKFLKKDTDDYEFAYFGIFDGHGGPEASAFCKDNLLNEITKYDGFWTDDDEEVLSAVRKGFLDTHNAMWNVVDSWPKTVTGLPSTAGSTATIAIIKQGKLYTGHVGDSALVLGENCAFSGDEFAFQPICITKEHKPDDPDERLRIEDAGGEVINKSGVPRVVWSRPKTNHRGPVRRSTQIDQIPFLAVARSLGDLWSYDYYTETYVVSPDPDVTVMKLDPSKHRCLILASDGLWNMLTPDETVNVVMDLETQFEQKIISDPSVSVSFWSNPAERLVSRALNKWRSKSLKADNTSCVVVLIDPLGPSKLTLLRQKRQALMCGGEITTHLSKVPKLPIEAEHRNRTRNKNANCSLSESHFRASDDSILQLITDQERVVLPAHEQSFTDVSKLGPRGSGVGEDSSIESLKDSVQTNLKPPVKWNLRHSLADRLATNSNSIKSSSGYSKKMNLCPDYSESVNSSEQFQRKSKVVFTKLVNGSNVANTDTESKRRMKLTKEIQQMNSRQLIENLHDDFVKYLENKIEVEENDGLDSDLEKLSPESPLCSDVKKLDVNESRESSLQASAGVTSKAFSLASYESIESPLPSFSSDKHVAVFQPLSVPAKVSLSGARMSSTSRKQLARNGRKLHLCSKPPSGLSTKPVFNLPDSIANSCSTIEAVNSCIKTVHANSSVQDNVNRNEITELIDTVAAVATPALTKDTHTKNHTNHLASPVKHTSLPQQVLNISKSTNDFFTPSNQKKKLRSVSNTGLTPDMNLLMSKVPKPPINRTVCTTSADARNQFFSSLMTADSSTILTNGFRETSMVIDDQDILHESSMPTQTGPLKQLNKAGPVRKVTSKRWGHFLRMSKQGIDQIFHQGSHHKDTGKLSRSSVGILDCDNSKVIGDDNTLSNSQYNDAVLTHNLPDVTISHLADLTGNESVAVDNLSNCSAVSEDNVIFAAASVHHSMLGESLPGKINKQRKGFLQKTKLTLRRASKAAKKAFFPENDRLFHMVGRRKRRSSEFVPASEMKRRKQQTNRT